MALRSPANRKKATGTKNVDPDVQMKLFTKVKSLMVNETQFMAAEGYYNDKEAKSRRQSAARLIEKIWKSQGHSDALVPYLALNYYDRLVSRNPIPVVVLNSEENENLFVVFCLTIALKLIIKKFKFSEFLENHDVKDYKDELIKMTDGICVGLANMKVTITSMHFTVYFALKLLQPSYSEHMDRTRSLANKLIMKSQNDIAMTAFKPSVVAASAVLAISLKLFPTEAFNNNLITRMLDDNIVGQGPVLECTQEMEKWTDGLLCTPIKTDLAPIDEEDPGINLGWFDDCTGFLGNFISCFGLNEDLMLL